MSTSYEWLVAAIENTGEDCIEWPFSRGRDGYGSVSVQGRTRSAHRVACALAHGEPAPGMQVRHSCDNRACVNPRHLSWGTNRQNVQDMYDRGRNVTKLTDEQVAEIRRRGGYGKASPSELAAEYGVTQSHVSAILLRRTRRSVPNGTSAE